MIFKFLIAALAIFAASCPAKKVNLYYNPKATISAGEVVAKEENKNNLEEALNRNNSLFITLLYDILYEDGTIASADNIENLSDLIENGTALDIISASANESRLKNLFLLAMNNTKMLFAGNIVEVSVEEVNKVIYEITKDDSLALENLADTDGIQNVADRVFDIFSGSQTNIILKIMLELLKLIHIDLSLEKLDNTIASIGGALSIERFYAGNVRLLIGNELKKLKTNYDSNEDEEEGDIDEGEDEDDSTVIVG